MPVDFDGIEESEQGIRVQMPTSFSVFFLFAVFPLQTLFPYYRLLCAHSLYSPEYPLLLRVTRQEAHNGKETGMGIFTSLFSNPKLPPSFLHRSTKLL